MKKKFPQSKQNIDKCVLLCMSRRLVFVLCFSTIIAEVWQCLGQFIEAQQKFVQFLLVSSVATRIVSIGVMHVVVTLGPAIPKNLLAHFNISAPLYTARAQSPLLAQKRQIFDLRNKKGR